MVLRFASLTLTRDIDCRGPVAHRAAECRRRLEGRTGVSEGKSRPESGAACGIHHAPGPWAVLFHRAAGEYPPGLFVETPPTFCFFYFGFLLPGCRAAAAAHHTPSLGLCVSRYEHHTTQHCRDWCRRKDASSALRCRSLFVFPRRNPTQGW